MLTMKKLSIPMAALAVGAALFGNDAYAASASGSATAQIAAPISIGETASLSFGTVTTSATAGTVVITTAGARTVTGGVSTLGGAPAAGAFSVAGEGTASYTVSLPSSASLSGPGTAMTVDGFSISGLTTRSLVGGADTFSLGATLNVNANQTSGAYSGSYTVSVNYN